MRRLIADDICSTKLRVGDRRCALGWCLTADGFDLSAGDESNHEAAYEALKNDKSPTARTLFKRLIARGFFTLYQPRWYDAIWGWNDSPETSPADVCQTLNAVFQELGLIPPPQALVDTVLEDETPSVAVTEELAYA